MPRLALAAVLLFKFTSASGAAAPWEVVGVTVTPHVQADGMRYGRAPDPSLGARVQLFLRNVSAAEWQVEPERGVRFRGRTPDELVESRDWAWHDAPSAWPDYPLRLPPGALSVWHFNTRDAAWGVDTDCELTIACGDGQPADKQLIHLAAPKVWISAATFLSSEDSVFPNRLVLHVANQRDTPLRLEWCRLWLPSDNAQWRALIAGEVIQLDDCFPRDGVIPPSEKGGAVVKCDRLPLTYAAIEVQCRSPDGEAQSLWTHLRIKREVFDISGGWVDSSVGERRAVHYEPFLKTLKRMHVNTAHIAEIPGYTDQDGPDGLYTRYPLKYFNRLQPLVRYDTDALLPRVHAVEFLGEPQYGGGRPVPPMEVWRSLAPYQRTRLPTSLTHSEERVWRYYAGLSDYPHYDAYRVSAPSPDAWLKYDRWNGQRIGWGAPLETIGDMCRSLRELNRPLPTAYWSQGPHAGWGSYGGRQRTSPTADELRLQAYHALASRITSLYWFNLSLPSLLKFPDLIDPLTQVGREIRLVDQLYLEGDAYHYRRVRQAGSPDWDLATIAAPSGGLLFALDLAYRPDADQRVFVFGPPREVRLWFPLPPHLRRVAELFRFDSDSSHDVPWQLQDGGVEVVDRVSKAAVYAVSIRPGMRAELDARRQALTAEEAAVGFDPAGNADDLTTLQELLDASR